MVVDVGVGPQAERENDAVEKAQHKAQEDALVDAILAFDQGLRADLDAVKAGGGPYKVPTELVPVSILDVFLLQYLAGFWWYLNLLLLFRWFVVFFFCYFGG